MNSLELIKNLVVSFQSSFEFLILKQLYIYDSTVEKYLNDYITLVNDDTDDLNLKYNNLKKYLSKSLSIALNSIEKLDCEYILEKPNFNISKESLQQLEDIKTLLKDKELRKYLFTKELYNLYFYYYQIMTFVNNQNFDSQKYTKIIKFYYDKIDLRKEMIILQKQRLNELNIIKETITNLNNALIECYDTELINNINKQLISLKQLISELNIKLKGFTLLPADRKNIYNPFVEEIIKLDNQEISIIKEYKSIDIINSDYNNMSYDEKNNADMEIKMHIMVINSLDSLKFTKIDGKIIKLKDNSIICKEIADLSKIVHEYDTLIDIKNKFENKLIMIDENNKIYNGVLSYIRLGKIKYELNTKIDHTMKEVSQNEQKIYDLNDQEILLSNLENKYSKMNIFKKFTLPYTIIKNKMSKKRIKKTILDLENKNKNSKLYIEYEKNEYEKLENNFLNNYGLEGMTIEEYGKRLAMISSNHKEMVGPSAKIKLEKEFNECLNQIEEMKNNRRYQIANDTINLKKQELGIY